MKRTVVMAMLLAAACESKKDEIDPDPAKGSASAKSKKKKVKNEDEGTGAVDCNGYCKKLSECFPGAIKLKVWNDICTSDCSRDAEADPDTAAFEASVAACKSESCTGGFHECVSREFSARLPKETQSRLDIRGLPGTCAAQRACITTQTYNYEQNRRRTRDNTFAIHASSFQRYLRGAASSAEMACRMFVESEWCSGRPPPQPGTPIAVDCAAHCDKLKQCYPGLSMDAGRDANCKSDCEREAAAGTTVAGFFATIADCKAEACGASFGACLTQKIASHWPKGQPTDWDPRGLPVSCFLMRACNEAMFVAYAQAYLSREATYKSWRDVFTTLIRDGGDPDQQCKSMSSYTPDCK